MGSIVTQRNPCCVFMQRFFASSARTNTSRQPRRGQPPRRRMAGVASHRVVQQEDVATMGRALRETRNIANSK